MIEIEVEMETDVLAAETASNMVNHLNICSFWVITSWYNKFLYWSEGPCIAGQYLRTDRANHGAW